MRSRAVVPTRPVGVSVFPRGRRSRFGLACLGSRLATGATTWETARALTDRDGVALGDMVAGAGRAARRGRDLRRAPRRAGRPGRPWRGCRVASGIWPHGRYRFEVTGQANHAGTTWMEDRVDLMLTYAFTALAANKQARLAGQRATFGRVAVEPNGTNAVPSKVTAWLDELRDRVRAGRPGRGDLRAGDRPGRARRDLARHHGRVGVGVGRLRPTSPPASPPTDHEGGSWPVIPTQAGHDAGILAAAGIPTAMLFVRNPTGVSHSPDEHAEVADCLVGVSALADTLERLAG